MFIKRINEMKNLTFFLALCWTFIASAQSPFSGFNYQAVIRNSSGIPAANQNLTLKIEIRQNSTTGTILFDEEHNAVSNNAGYVNLTVGQGTSLGNGTYPSFSSIAWNNSLFFLNLLSFDQSSSTYSLISSQPIFAVPFALTSQKTLQPFFLNTLSDVDPSGLQQNQLLKWNGVNWVPANDLKAGINDTVGFALNADSANYSATAGFALNANNIIPSDTAQYSYLSGNAATATNASFAENSDTAIFSQSSLIANTANNTWNTTGNLGTNSSINFLGTKDATDLVFRTNDTIRMVVKSTGRVGIGTSSPAADLHVSGKKGFTVEGTFGAGSIPVQGAGTRLMWYPKKAAFRGGTLDAGYATYWDDIRIGNYSFAFGKNTRADGHYSLSLGEQCVSQADYSAAIGNNCSSASGALYSFAAGTGSQTYGESSVAIGRGNISRGIGGVAIGYHCEANGNYTLSFGFYSKANGNNSTALGYQAITSHDGSFLYVDYSNTAGVYTYTTAPNQFMVRAAGGVYFYSSPTLASGVSLATGSGSWSTLSDSTKKENLVEVNYSEILDKISRMKVYSWNYKTQDPGIRHIGPTAQEFFRTFNVGEDSKTISTVDFDGINLAGIKALKERNALLEKRTSELESALQQVEKLKKERKELERRLLILESKVTEMNLANGSATLSK